MAATGPAASSANGTPCRRQRLKRPAPRASRRRSRSRPTSRREPRPLQMNRLARPRRPRRPGLSSCSSNLRATQTDGLRLCRHCPLALSRPHRCLGRQLRIGNRGNRHPSRSRSSRVGKKRRTPKRQRNSGAKSTRNSRSPKKCSLHPPRPPPPHPSSDGQYRRLARSRNRARLEAAIGVPTRCRSALSKAIALPAPISRNTTWVICRP